MKIVIVEDEALCLNTLRQLPWDTIGIQVAGCVQNIDDATEVIQKTHPQIVLTDIKMPGGSGIDLAKHIFTMMPNTKIIFLTAYDSFDYAKQAFSYNVFDYLLKPIDPDIILRTVQKAAEKINKEIEKENNYIKMEQQISNSIQFMKGYFFNILENKTSVSDETLEMFNIKNRNGVFSVFVANVHEAGGEQNSEPFVYHRAFRETKQILSAETSCGLLAFFEEDTFTYILEHEENSSIQNALGTTLAAAETVKKYLDFNIPCSYFVGVAKPVSGILNLFAAERRAREALKYNFCLGNNQILYIEDIEPIQYSLELKSELEEKYISAIKIGDKTTVTMLLNEMFDRFRDSMTDIETVQRICLEFIVKLSLVMIQFGLDANILFDKTNIWLALKQHRTLEQLHSLMCDVTLITMSQISEEMSDKNKNMIHEVKEFVNENFHRDISLTNIAEKLYVSPSYLSTIFSNEVGITFKKYLTNLRIERAKYLLSNTDLSIGKIAENVGYNNQAYFSKQFSIMTKMLPSVYRSNSQNDKNI